MSEIIQNRDMVVILRRTCLNSGIASFSVLGEYLTAGTNVNLTNLNKIHVGCKEVFIHLTRPFFTLLEWSHSAHEYDVEEPKYTEVMT